MEYLRRLGLIAVMAALVAWLPGQAEAQQVGVAVDGFGGIAAPASDIGDFQKVGPSFGLGVEYMITDRFFVRGSGGLDMHRGQDADELSANFAAPDMTLFHYTAGVGARLSPPDETNWDVSLSLEAGGTSVSTDDFPDAATPPQDGPDFSATYFTLSPGLRVGYIFNDRVNVFVRSQPHFAFADKDDTAVFTQFDVEVSDDGFESIWNVPATAGLQIHF